MYWRVVPPLAIQLIKPLKHQRIGLTKSSKTLQNTDTVHTYRRRSSSRRRGLYSRGGRRRVPRVARTGRLHSETLYSNKAGGLK